MNAQYDEIGALAAGAHAGQTGKAGVAYIEHVRAVADGLAGRQPGTHEERPRGCRS